GKVVGIGIAVVEETAMLDDEATRVETRPAGVPAARRMPSQGLNDLDASMNVVPLLVLGHLGIVDPPPAMSDEIATRLRGRFRHPRFAFERQADGIECRCHVALLEGAQ